MIPEILRHGKQAHANDGQRNLKSAAAPPVEQTHQPAAAESSSAQSSSNHQQHQQQQQQTHAPKSNAQAQQTQPAKQKDYRQEAEKIVAEEKAMGDRMPTYEVCQQKSLTDFRDWMRSNS